MARRRVDIIMPNGTQLTNFEVGVDDQITAGLNQIWILFSILGYDIRQTAMSKVSLKITRDDQLKPLLQHELMRDHLKDWIKIFNEERDTGISFRFI